MAYPNFLYSSKLYSEVPVRTGAFLVAYYSSSDKANDVKSLFVCPPDGDSWTYCGKNDIYTELENTSVSLDYSNVDLGVAKFYDCTSDLTSLTVTNAVSGEEPQTTMFVKFKTGEGFQLNLEGFTYLDEEVGTIPDLAEGYTYLLTIRNGFVTIDSSLRLDLTSATNEDIDNIFEESETSEDIKLLINVSNLRHFWNIAKESSKQSDWEQNEESEADYIKNRTHWSERSPFVYDNVKLNISFTVDEWNLVLEESESSESEGFMYTYNLTNIDPELFEQAIGEFEPHEDKDSYLEVTLFSKKYKPLRSISENSVGLTLDEPDENSIYEIKVSIETDQEDPYVQLQVFTTDELTETEGNVEYFGEETVHQLDPKYVPGDFVKREDLAPVALSGNYNDLQNRYRQQVHTTDITQEMVANTFYVWDNPLTENDSFSPEFSTDEDETIVNEYAGIFTTGDTVPTLAMPGGIIWLGGLPTLLPNHIYEFSVINEYGVFSPQDYTTTEMVQTMIDNARIQWEDLN